MVDSMCDMQKLPRRGNDACEEEDEEMNFAAFAAAAAGSASGAHFVTTTGQMPVTKIQQGVAANGTGLSQVMMSSDGMQYVRTLDGGAALTATPQLITVPISLPGAKPGDPQPTVQIQVLNPNMLQQQQQQPKYQMQIPIQGFQQGGAVLTFAYTSDGSDGGLQLLGNSLPEGLQVVTLPQEMQLVQQQQPDNKDQIQQHFQQQQMFIAQNQQIMMNSTEENKLNNNTTNNNNNPVADVVVIKEECDDINDDESSQGTNGASENNGEAWENSSQQDLINYLNKLPPQQTQTLPLSLQQFLKLNPATECKKVDDSDRPMIEIEINQNVTANKNDVTEAIISEDGTLRIKKKKKYKKKPPKPAKPKPGQVLITTANDGTPIFCCPECSVAYSEKEQLEMHLSVHKIERRFICDLCGAGLKRKEHLERHKLGHNPERPYVCAVCRKGFKRREHLNLHTVIHSGVKTELCRECGKGFYRKDHLRKHTRSHESKRARDESSNSDAVMSIADGSVNVNNMSIGEGNIKMESAEITIHVPTSGNVQVPVQINIPQHVVSSLAAQQQAHLAATNQNTLDALLAQHT